MFYVTSKILIQNLPKNNARKKEDYRFVSPVNNEHRNPKENTLFPDLTMCPLKQCALASLAGPECGVLSIQKPIHYLLH